MARKQAVAGVARRQLNEALIATGAPYKAMAILTNGAAFTAQLVRRFRHPAFWAASLDLAWLAAGRYDGFWESGLSPWTPLQDAFWCEKQAGSLPTIAARSPHIADTQLLAANDILHSKLHKLLVGALNLTAKSR